LLIATVAIPPDPSSVILTVNPVPAPPVVATPVAVLYPVPDGENVIVATDDLVTVVATALAVEYPVPAANPLYVKTFPCVLVIVTVSPTL